MFERVPCPRPSRAQDRGRRRGLVVLAASLGAAMLALAGCASSASPAAPIQLRLQVGETPEELAVYRPAIAAIDAAHPEWTISLETIPQGSEVEKITSELAGSTTPDVLRITGSNAQQFIRRNAFVDLTPRIAAARLDMTDFYPGPLEQFSWQGSTWGIADSASPEIVFVNTSMFDAAGLPYPTDAWTFEDMRTAAKQLTLDSAGRNANDPAFDPGKIVQWGWNGGITYYWQDALVEALGGELCADADCTTMDFTSPATSAAMHWWVSLVRDDHAGLYDPYGGSQTGVEGDPFIAGKAAMGSNGTFAIGQLNASGTLKYDIAPPFLGMDGKRRTPLSTNGYVISATSTHADAAWALVQLLVAPDFLASTWGKPGNGVPARISAAGSVVDASHPPVNQGAILTAMEVGRVFRPSTPSSFAAYQATLDLFMKLNTGQVSEADGLRQLEAAANAALAPDRAP